MHVIWRKSFCVKKKYGYIKISEKLTLGGFAVSSMTGFDAKMTIARQRFRAMFSARNSVNMTCYTFSQFMVTVAPSENK